MNEANDVELEEVENSITIQEESENIIESAEIQVEQENLEDSKIKEIINNYLESNQLDKTNFAFFYYDIENEKYYFYNEDKYFTAASTIKVPLAMIYYDKINHGDLNLDSTLTYTQEDYEAGAGKITAKYKAGDSISIENLLKEMIENSDNTATNILKMGLGGEKAYKILIKQYTKDDLIDEFNTENVTTAKYLLDVLKYLYQNQEKYQDLIEYMKNSSGGGYLKKYTDSYEIAHKYGNLNGYVHDYGIVYTEEPFLIGIFTKDIKNAEDLIANINKTIIENN